MAAGQDNPKKFNGLAETYHSVRPVLPEFPMKMIQKYLGYFLIQS